MVEIPAVLAVDLGAESGRVVLGEMDGQRLAISEIHRFPNQAVRTPDGLHWDVLFLFSKIKEGLAKAIQTHRGTIDSLGLDAWGVDFALLDRSGSLISNPHAYRDSRTEGILPKAFARVPREEIFFQTGIQIMQINTVYQLLSMAMAGSPALAAAHTLLTIPDLFNYWLAGSIACEFTNATTTQCYDTRRGQWAEELLAGLGLPARIFPQVVPPGTRLGRLLPGVVEETGASPELQVIAPACHDTGSAVAAVPADGPNFAYISSGTWSLLGTEVRQPLVNRQTLDLNFTNEGGVEGTYRLLKNIPGMWLVQECRRIWALQGRSYTYDELTGMASGARAFQTLINVDDPAFLRPASMPESIRAACRRAGQPVPEGEGEMVRCILESLALTYRRVLEQLETIVGNRLEPVHIVGGGSRNRLLNQFTANATRRSSGRGAGRSHGHREYARPADRPGKVRLAGRRARAHPPVVPAGGVRAGRRPSLGGRLRPV